MKIKAKQLDTLVGQAIWDLSGVIIPAAASVVVTTGGSGTFAGKTSGGGDTAAGVYTTAPQNYILMRNAADGKALIDSSQRQIFGRLTYLAGTWTVSFYVIIAGVETAHNFTGSVYVGETLQYRWCETVQIANSSPTNIVFGGEGIDEIISSDPMRHNHFVEPVTIVSEGQTALTLAHTPKSDAAVKMIVNGVEQLNGTDFTVVGTSVTYLDVNHVLNTTDTVWFDYESDAA